MELNEWKVFGGTVELERTHMKVDHVDMEIVVQDTSSRNEQNNEAPFYFTDLQFQPGSQKTGWNPNTKEMMDRIEYDVNEWRKYLAGGNPDPQYRWKTVVPKQYPGQTERMFNLVGRGHEVITIPNDLPEERFWRLIDIEAQGLKRPVEILTTGIDFKIIPKDDFDLMRISTDVGSILPEDEWPYKEHIERYKENNPNGVQQYFVDNPLNRRYTREFWFKGGKTNDVLEVDASVMVAKRNGSPVKANGVRQVDLNDVKINIYKNKFQMIPRGSVRFRVEFYKKEDVRFIRGYASGKAQYDTIPVLQDTGIGFGGIATFNQWTYGVERL